MTVGATNVCYLLHFWALARLDALRVSIFTDVQPILAGALAHVWGMERITWPLAISGLVVIGGVALVQRGGPRFPSREIPWMRVEACETCRHYLKAIDPGKNAWAEPVVDEIGSTPLDEAARERGYAKREVNAVGV